MGNQAFVLLGSNIDKERNLPKAVGFLGDWCKVLKVSTVYETCPVGLERQPTFFNAAVLIETRHTARVFTREILARLESKLGRVRAADKNAPRTIDADLVLFNREVFDLDDSHHIPDPDLLKFRHVAVPIAELMPDYLHPEAGESLISIANRLVEIADRSGRKPLIARPDIRVGANSAD